MLRSVGVPYSGVAAEQQGNEREDAVDIPFNLNRDVVERIWEHLPVADLLRMSTVSKGWRRSIRIFTMAKRAALVALVSAPDNTPDEGLPKVQFAFRWLKRVLLFKDGFTGGPMGCDAIKRREEENSRGNDGRYREYHYMCGSYAYTLLGANLAYSLRQRICIPAARRSWGWGFRKGVVFNDAVIRAYSEKIALRIERVPFRQDFARATLLLQKVGPEDEDLVDGPWVGDLLEGIVLALAQGMSVRLPCGRLASSIELCVKVRSTQGASQHWLATLPGRERVSCDMKEGVYSNSFVVYPATITVPLS